MASAAHTLIAIDFPYSALEDVLDSAFGTRRVAGEAPLRKKLAKVEPVDWGRGGKAYVLIAPTEVPVLAGGIQLALDTLTARRPGPEQAGARSAIRKGLRAAAAKLAAA